MLNTFNRLVKHPPIGWNYSNRIIIVGQLVRFYAIICEMFTHTLFRIDDDNNYNNQPQFGGRILFR